MSHRVILLTGATRFLGRQIRRALAAHNVGGRGAGALIADCALGDMQWYVNVCPAQGIQLRELGDRIAEKYGRGNLLKFGTRASNLMDPPCVVAVLAL